MSDPIPARCIEIDNCAPDCSCQSVHLCFLDAEGDVFAVASLQPSEARAVAADLARKADMADAQRVKLEGRLS